MKYLGAIADSLDLVNKGYVDGKTVSLADLYDSLNSDMTDILENYYGYDRSGFISLTPDSAFALLAEMGFSYPEASAVYSTGTKIATVGGVDIYVPVYSGGVS